MNLYWDTDGQLPFNKVAMTVIGEGNYIGEIPAQKWGSKVEYFVNVVDEYGFYNPLHIFSFKVDLDTKLPVVTVLNQKANQISNRSIVNIQAFAEDNVGIDTTSARVLFWLNPDDKDSSQLKYDGDGKFVGDIDGNFQFNDTLYYQFYVQDISLNKNLGLSDIYTIFIGYEDFESGLDQWQVDDDSWGLDTFRPHSGYYSLSESPGKENTYPANADLRITLKKGLDLSDLTSANLSFWHFYGLLPNDEGRMEISNNGGEDWVQLGGVFTKRNRFH